MEKLVVLRLNGEVDQGFGVTLIIYFEGDSPELETTGSLPAATELVKQYENWHSIYRLLDYTYRIKQQKADSTKVEIDSYLQRLRQECQKSAEKLKEQLNEWLDFPGFRQINKELIDQLDSDDDVRFLISTESSQLRKLPWHLWSFLELYPKAEIALSALESQKPSLSSTFGKEVNILAIVGNSEGMDIEKDREELLKNIPNAKITLLNEPEYQELNDSLWEQPWDILFFAGHGRTEGRRGRIYINQTHGPDSLTTDEIKSAVRKAIEKGLQLAIFNCCDALGLARELEKLNIPQTIVMREALPDKVAYKFLIDFLPEFAKGAHLYASVRSARSKLEELENEFPCASWLPIIYQNPTVRPFTWDSLLAQKALGKNLLSAERMAANNLSKAKKIEKLEIEQGKTPAQEIAETVIPRTNNPLPVESTSLVFQPSQPKNKNKKVWLGFSGIATLAMVVLLFSSLRLKQSFTISSPQKPKAVSTFREVENVPSGSFDYGGSTTWAPIREQVDPVIQLVWPEFDLRYAQHPSLPPGSVTGIKMLLNDRLTIAQSSRPLKTEEYDRARQQNYSLKQVPVAIDALAIAVNPNLPIPGLTINQIKDIYLGKITNWQQVGGPDIEILPYSRSSEAGGTVQFFVENVLENSLFANSVIFVSNTTQGLRSVTENLGGIYYASASEVVRQCKIKPLPIGRESTAFIPPYAEPFVPQQSCPARRNQLNHEAFHTASYPITRNLYVIIKQNGKVEEQAGEAYINLLLSDQGQELIDKAGFVRIR